MNGRFVEGDEFKIGIVLRADTDEERLLFRALDRQLGGSAGRLQIVGLSYGGEPNLLGIRLQQVVEGSINTAGEQADPVDLAKSVMHMESAYTSALKAGLGKSDALMVDIRNWLGCHGSRPR